MVRASQDWVGENVMIKTKSPTSDKRLEGPGPIRGGTAHPIRLVFWEEGNDPLRKSICILARQAKPPTLTFQAPILLDFGADLWSN